MREVIKQTLMEFYTELSTLQYDEAVNKKVKNFLHEGHKIEDKAISEISALFPRWISVGKELPKTNDWYWTLDEHYNLEWMGFIDGEWHMSFGMGKSLYKILFWTTTQELKKILPELPKE